MHKGNLWEILKRRRRRRNLKFSCGFWFWLFLDMKKHSNLSSMGRLKAHPTLTDDEVSIQAASPLIQICDSGLSCMLAQCVDLWFCLSETDSKAKKNVTFRPANTLHNWIRYIHIVSWYNLNLELACTLFFSHRQNYFRCFLLPSLYLQT